MKPLTIAFVAMMLCIPVTRAVEPAPIELQKITVRPDAMEALPVGEYTVGIDDILAVNVLQPEQIFNECIVSPDGSIAFPYIGSVMVKGLTINQVQEEVQRRLSDGYLKYPSVVVSLKESRSRKFFVYGEVIKPGPYPMDENTTVLRAISIAGGFTRFGSASRVKVLRPKKQGSGYETIQVKIKSVMEGDSSADVALTSGDIVVVSEGIL